MEENEEKQSVSSDLIRGHINTIILRALYDGDKYGYEIISDIERKSHGQYTLKQPSLYSALKRLEKDGYITSYWGGSVSGGRRKYFSLTDAGKDISETNQSEWEYSRTVIDSLISDKDFDFNNPAPGAVNMRVLRDTTSRTPTGGSETNGEEETLLQDSGERDKSLREREAALESEEKRIAEERSAFEENASRFEEARLAFEENAAKFEEMRKKYEAEMEARNEALLLEREWREHEIAEREKKLEEERNSLSENRTLATHEERITLETRIHEQETELEEQRTRYEDILRRREDEIEETRARYQEEMETREKQIIAEQETLFREREQELIHRNYLNLINTPPAESSADDYDYYTAPVGDEPTDGETVSPLPAESDEREYRPVVRKIFANAVKPEASEPVEGTRATSLDGIDFHDLEARAAKDGIRLYTAGGKSKTQIAEISTNVVHKGKALFISSIALFLFCIVLGSVLLGVSSNLALPAFYPYFIWVAGLAVLLVAGLAYANHYGERSLRRTTPAILNAIVLFVLLVIITLIVALAVRIDFNNISSLMTYVIVPILFFFGVVVFGTVYYLVTKSKNGK